MKKFWTLFKLFFREIGNFLTNLLCPVISVITAGMELCHMPIKWINTMKKVEHWCWKACGTKDVIDKIIEKIDDKIEDNADSNA